MTQIEASDQSEKVEFDALDPAGLETQHAPERNLYAGAAVGEEVEQHPGQRQKRRPVRSRSRARAIVTRSHSPPPAAQPPREDHLANDARAKLLQLAAELMRSHNRRLVIEYLRLRRAMA